MLHLAAGAMGDDIAVGHLADAAKAARTGHLIPISVGGADAMPSGCFRAKEASDGPGVPRTVLRSAQPHRFVWPVLRMLARLPLAPAPGGLRLEPVHVEEIAAGLAKLALDGPAGRVPDLVGPEVLEVQRLLAARIIKISAVEARRAHGRQLSMGVGPDIKGRHGAVIELPRSSSAIELTAGTVGCFDAVATLMGQSPAALLDSLEALRGLPGIKRTVSWSHQKMPPGGLRTAGLAGGFFGRWFLS